MGENPSQIEREIREERSDLDRNLRTLEDKTREMTDWRTHHRNHPGVFLGLAFGAGMVLGLTTVPRARRSTGSAWPERDTSHDPLRPMGAVSANASGTRAMARRQIAETWEHVADALLRVASLRLVDFVSELVPGFRDQFDRQARGSQEYGRESYRSPANV
jgi:hypothetical protein